MPHSIGFGKLERKALSNGKLPPDLRPAMIEFKNQLKRGVSFKEYENKYNDLPTAAAGQVYYKCDVGQAHAGDPGSPRGIRRLVALVDPVGRILKMYFHDEHYRGQNGWRQLQWP